jgi:pilus assembly protein Flp/PilA
MGAVQRRGGGSISVSLGVMSGVPDETERGKAPRRRADMLEFISNMRNREDGQALVEYALILALVSIVSIAALTVLGTNINDLLQSVADTISAA